MALAIVHSRACVGLHAPLVTVETHISNGMPKLSIVGLPEAAVKESKDRVRSALLNAKFEFPSSRRVTINLAPADLPKEGGRFDLPIAIGILAASGQIPLQSLEHYEFAGELALSGELRPVQGALPFAIGLQSTGRQAILPLENAEEASLPEGVTVLPARHLLDVCAHLTGHQQLIPHVRSIQAALPVYPDLNEVQGQPQAKRALEIAATGGHSLLMIGSPGTGKTMLASRLPGLLPSISHEEALEVAALASVSGAKFKSTEWRKRPFRSPHHTVSSVALVGGGGIPRPGEISLAHRGILFLDELPEFSRTALETLREPLESGTVTISRAARQAEFPAAFQLVAAMNPCPCGYLGHSHQQRCHCSADQIQRYRARISGPLLDRIDLHIEVPALPPGMLGKDYHQNENTETVRARVEKVRRIQLERQGKINSALQGKELKVWAGLATADQQLLERAMEKLGLSARTYHRLLRIARTIADMANSPDIATEHLTEALSYRYLDRSIALGGQ